MPSAPPAVAAGPFFVPAPNNFYKSIVGRNIPAEQCMEDLKVVCPLSAEMGKRAHSNGTILIQVLFAGNL